MLFIGSLLLANVLLIYTIHDGLLKSNDSICYLEIARKYALAQVFESCYEYPLIYWPPLFPVILSYVYDAPTILILINIICLNLILFFWYQISDLILASTVTRRLFIASLSISTPLIMIHVFLWSEAIFVLLLSGFIFQLLKYNHSNKIIYLIIATLMTMLLLLQRNAGIFIITPIYLALFIIEKNRQRLQLFFSYIIAAIPWLLWNVFQLKIANDINIIEGLYPKWTLLENFYLTISEIGKYFVPGLFDLSFVFGVILFCVYCLLFIQDGLSNQVKVILAGVLFYLVFWFTVPQDKYETSRYLSVIMPMVLIVMFYLIDLLRNKVKFIYTKEMITISISGYWLYLIIRLSNNVFFTWG